MKKRILSFLLAILILITALPFGTVVAEDTVTDSTTVSDSFAAEIKLDKPDFPEKVTTFKSANSFPTKADTFRAMCNSQSVATDWDPGISFDEEGNAVNLNSYASLSSGTLTANDGSITITSGATKSTMTLNLVFKSTAEANTNYIALDVDASNLQANANARVYMGRSTNPSSGTNTVYAGPNQTYYFKPDATEENPNPVVEARKTKNTTNLWDCTITVKKGEKGTFYFPETMFVASSTTSSLNAWWVDENGYGDFSKYLSEEDESYLWHIHNGAKKYTGNSLYLSFRSTIPVTTDEVTNSITFGEMQWVANNNFELEYNAEYIANDFSDETNVSYTYWNNTHTMSVNNFATANGVWQHNITADDWNNESEIFRYGHTLELGYPVNSAFEALEFDVDFSQLTNSPELQMIYAVKDTKISTTDDVRRFIVANGDIYAVWKNGAVETITVPDQEWEFVTLPKGFNGTVVIPFESLRTMTKEGYHTYDGTTVDLFKSDDVDSFGLTIDMNNISYQDKGKAVFYDNYGYLTTLKPVLESGMNFSADAPIETDNRIDEEIKTVEAWVKVPEGTAEGTILANKYRIENTTSTDSVVLKMDASGNPVLYISDGDGLAVNFTVSDVDLRTDRWTHIAFSRNAEFLNCYINGTLKATTDIPEGFATVRPYHVLTIGHYIHHELGSAVFGGEVSCLKLWSKALTSSEILSSAINEPINADGLISGWTLSGANGFKDIAGNYNLEVYDLYTTKDDESYAEYNSIPENGYTFAVLPDTQIANQREAVTGDSTAFSGMYDWIVENKDAQNIKFVMGVGDITNHDKPAEYALAKKNFDKLTDAGIPWSVVGGNHDFEGESVGPNKTPNMNAGFPSSELAKLPSFGGFMKPYKMDNSFYYVTVNDTKYLILNLSCEPSNAVIEWANQVCFKNKDCKIIVVTHEYLTNDAEFIVKGYTGRNQGIDVWNKLVSQHENIIMAIGGHVSVADVQYNEAFGVNGNKVINILVDGQALDWKNPSYNMLLLLRFSADGSNVTFDYYSPTRDCFLDSNNHFTLDVDGAVSDVAFPKAPTADYTYSKYHSGEIALNYDYFSNDGSQLSIWSDTKHSDATINNFSWHNYNTVKFTASSDFFTNPDTVTDDNPEGTAYTYDRVGITFDELPNVVNENQTALSIYIDNSYANESTGIRLRYNNGTNAFRTNAGSIVYLIDENGNIKQKTSSGTHSTVDVPAGFKGSIVVPFTSLQIDGTTTFVDNTAMLKETQDYSAHLVLYILAAKPGQELIFNNVTYLEEYQAEDLAKIRNGLLGTDNGELIDVTSDTVVDARDIVRLKKILVDFYVK